MTKIPTQHTPVQASEQANRLCEKYTAANPICVDGEPLAHKVLIKIENQSFWIDGYQDTKEEADWLRLMIGKALETLLKAEG